MYPHEIIFCGKHGLVSFKIIFLRTMQWLPRSEKIVNRANKQLDWHDNEKNMERRGEGRYEEQNRKQTSSFIT